MFYTLHNDFSYVKRANWERKQIKLYDEIVFFLNHDKKNINVKMNLTLECNEQLDFTSIWGIHGSWESTTKKKRSTFHGRAIVH